MKQYKVFKHPAGSIEAVKQGWSWPAFFFSFIWAMVKKMWGLGIGVLSVLMGIGGGTLGVPAFQAFGVPIKRAVGTGAALGLIIGIPGCIGFIASGWGNPALPPLSFGYVSLVGLCLIVPATIVMAPYGVRTAHSLDSRMLRRAFALFLLLTSLKMFSSLG